MTNKKSYDKITIENEKQTKIEREKIMRKLVYEIYNGNEKINEVATYEEMKEMKAKGFTIKDKMVDLHERMVFEIYNGKEKIDEVTTFKARKEYLDKGYTSKTVTRVF